MIIAGLKLGEIKKLNIILNLTTSCQFKFNRMDSLTQIVLGAAFGELALSKKN